MKTRQSGLTLIELLIVIVIIALLATIAWPSYQTFIRQSRLNNVRSTLLENAEILERYYAQKSTFVGFTKADLLQNDYFEISFNSANTTIASTSSIGTRSVSPNSSAQSNASTSSATDNPSDSGFILQAVPTADYADNEPCTVYLNDSGIFWAVSNNSAMTCPGFEEPHS